MQTGSSGTHIGWKSGQTTYVPLWGLMEGEWLWTQYKIPFSSPYGTLFFTSFVPIAQQAGHFSGQLVVPRRLSLY
jgi:hypothetical protein